MAVDFNTFMQRQAFGGVQPMQTPTGQASPVAPNANPASDRNQRLGLMLFALGGALRGDEDFVQKTIQIQQMQEGKKKEQAEQEKYDDFVRKLPDGTFKDLALAVGKQGLNQLLFEKYKSEQPKEKNVGDFRAEILGKIQRGETLTSTDQKVLDVIQDTDPIEIAMRSTLGGMGLGMDTTIENTNVINTQEEYDNLPDKAVYTFRGIEYVKGE